MTSILKRIKSLVSTETIPYLSQAQNKSLARSAEYGGAIVLGKLPNDEVVSFGLSAHMISFGAARTNKTRGLIIPNVATYDGPVAVIGLRGEGLMMCGRQRAKSRRVVAIDPYETCKQWNSDYIPEQASYNVLDAIEADTCMSDIKLIVDAMIKALPNGKADDHWRKTAKIYISGLMHYVYSKRDEFGDNANLITIYSLLKLSDKEERAKLWSNMSAVAGLSQSAATLAESAASEELTSILATATKLMSWLEIPELARSVEKSTFSFDEINENKSDFFVCIPPERSDQSVELMRLFASLPILNAMRKPVSHAILTVIEEAPLLGNLPAVVNVFRFAAGKGIHMWITSQTKDDLEQAYGKADFEGLYFNAEFITVSGAGYSTCASTLRWLLDVNFRHESINTSNRFVDLLTKKPDSEPELTESQKEFLVALSEFKGQDILLLPRSRELEGPAKIRHTHTHDPAFEAYALKVTGDSQIFDENPLYKHLTKIPA